MIYFGIWDETTFEVAEKIAETKEVKRQEKKKRKKYL